MEWQALVIHRRPRSVEASYDTTTFMFRFWKTRREAWKNACLPIEVSGPPWKKEEIIELRNMWGSRKHKTRSLRVLYLRPIFVKAASSREEHTPLPLAWWQCPHNFCRSYISYWKLSFPTNTIYLTVSTVFLYRSDRQVSTSHNLWPTYFRCRQAGDQIVSQDVARYRWSSWVAPNAFCF